MTAVPAPVSSTAAGALSAFLRGVERRALVVAELQCGDAARAEQTLVAVMRAFAAVASDLPMAQWPTRFWTLLGQRQALREPVGGQWLPPLAALGEMGPLPRLALLLRVGGSLDEGIAMRVLDQDEAGYQHLLADACPVMRSASPMRRHGASWPNRCSCASATCRPSACSSCSSRLRRPPAMKLPRPAGAHRSAMIVRPPRASGGVPMPGRAGAAR